MHHRGAMVLSQRGDLKARRLRYFSVLYLRSLRARAARSCSIRTVTTMTARRSQDAFSAELARHAKEMPLPV